MNQKSNVYLKSQMVLEVHIFMQRFLRDFQENFLQKVLLNGTWGKAPIFFRKNKKRW